MTERKGNKGHAKCEGKIPEKGRQGGEGGKPFTELYFICGLCDSNESVQCEERTAFVLTEDKGI